MGLQNELRDFENIYAGFSAANYTANDSQNSVFAEYLVDYAQTSLALSLREIGTSALLTPPLRVALLAMYYGVAASQSRLHLSFGQGITNPSFSNSSALFQAHLSAIRASARTLQAMTWGHSPGRVKPLAALLVGILT